MSPLHPQLARLRAQADRATLGRKVIARVLVGTVLLGLAMALGMVFEGFGLMDAAHGSLLRAPLVALGVLLAPALLAHRLPAGLVGDVVTAAIATLSFGAALVAVSILGDGHPPSADAWGTLAGQAQRPGVWVGLVSVGFGAGLGARARCFAAPWLPRWGWGLAALLVGLGLITILPGLDVGQPWLGIGVLALALPHAQLMWLVLVVADASSVGALPTADRPDDGPIPPLGALDGMFARMAGGGWFEVVPVGLALLSGLETGSVILGPLVVVLSWVLLKVIFSLGSWTWQRRLLAADPERALAFARARAHGRTGQRRSSTQAGLVAALFAAGEEAEAEEVARALIQRERMTVPLVQAAVVALATAERHALLLDLLAACAPPKGPSRTLAAIQGAAALLALNRADEAAALLNGTPKPSNQGHRAVWDTYLLLARLSLQEPIASNQVDEARGSRAAWPHPIADATLAACLVASEQAPREAMQLLQGAAQADALPESVQGFAAYWLARAAAACGELGPASQSRSAAIELGTQPWAERAGALDLA